MNHQLVAVNTNPTTSATRALTLLTFKVGDYEYGLPATDVVHIIKLVTITYLPEAPPPIQGIINLRGKAVPIMDMRHSFGLAPHAYSLYTPIILADITGQGQLLGLIVDLVEQVLHVAWGNLERSDPLKLHQFPGQTVQLAACLAAVAKVDRRVILTLNPQALLTPADQSQLSQALARRGRVWAKRLDFTTPRRQSVNPARVMMPS